MICLFAWQSTRKREDDQDSEGEIFYQLVYSSVDHSGQVWAWLKLGARSSKLVFPWVVGAQVFGPFFLFLFLFYCSGNYQVFGEIFESVVCDLKSNDNDPG